MASTDETYSLTERGIFKAKEIVTNIDMDIYTHTHRHSIHIHHHINIQIPLFKDPQIYVREKDKKDEIREAEKGDKWKKPDER